MNRQNAHQFAGCTAVLTGAGSGIGRASAMLFAAAGARVIACDISEARLEQLANELPDHSLATVAGDITDERTVQEVIDAANGRVDVLGNIAGVMDGVLPAEEVDDETWQRVFDVNVTASLRMTRAVLPLMRGRGHGAIVNVASEASFRGSVGGVAYTASKHAVVGLTKSTAFMYGPEGIRTNAVAPGAVDTGLDVSWRSDFGVSRTGPVLQATMSPPASPEQIARTILWLASEEAGNINGVILATDGGWSAV
ncbi:MULTISPECIES: SDR family NAD(P)-dependent oxidoreductase [unclassified Microbacterium]|uniref:SDR family NAD(P)-dependent oxidoreductase n=1 Tax=unclassified Microbacterium TaxID=2609290 RepID=UPI0012F9CB2D|nr:SDR family NAD(P)-dependent oxidoreductase [Microbacterium sp. MAH-37]MVQ42163.1 SDR family NAD(P)-dependent oxidoreductase [Microbacterium sp. MAH-37]